MSGVATAIVGGAVIGGIAANNAADKAAKSQENASKSANSLQLQMFNQQREDQQPWRESGARALRGLEDPNFQKDFEMADFQNDPGYQFRMQEGQKAINNAAASRGMGNSGATLKSLARYGQDFATNEYTNAYNRFNADRDRRFNRLSSLAGVGQTANSQIANAGQNYANNVGANIIGAGNARASAIVGGANATNNAIGQGMNSWMQYQMNKPATTPTTTGTTAGGGGYLGSGNYSW